MGKFLKIMTAYLLAAFFVVQFLGLKDDYVKAHIKACNEIPHDSFDELVSVLEGKTKMDPARIDAYLKYAQALLRHEPKRADAWGLSGLCFILTDDYQRAIFSYIQASSLEPQFFGFHYNLAYVYFKSKQYDLSVAAVEKALLCDPKQSLLYIVSSSKIYALMLVSRVKIGISVEDQLKRGYEKAYQLMAAGQYRLKMGMAFPGEEELSLGGF